MNKILIGIIAVIISVYPYNSYSKELSLEHQLFDKNNVGKINWKKKSVLIEIRDIDDKVQISQEVKF